YGIDGVAADLTTFGKVMGGGFPAAAFGGRADLMTQLAPSGPVYQAGTLAGNPVATTAGLTTLRLAGESVYATLHGHAATIGELARAARTNRGGDPAVPYAGNLFGAFFGPEGPVADLAAAKPCDPARFAAFFHAMLEAGVYLPPSAFEVWFVSAAHDERAIDRIAQALPTAEIGRAHV